MTQQAKPGRSTDRDKHLIHLFVEGLNEKTGSKYALVCHPDRENQQAASRTRAVDAVYSDPVRGKLAIEHTLLQMFIRQKEDDVRFSKVFEQLWSDRSLRVPGRLIDLLVRPLSIPKGSDWSLAAKTTYEWFMSVRLNLPDGESEHTIQGLPFDMGVTVDSSDITRWFPGAQGWVWVKRRLPEDSCRDVVRTALGTRLPKVAKEPAERHILLFECATPSSYREISGTIESLRPEFTDLQRIDAIWVVDTTAWETEWCAFYQAIWPGKVSGLFLVSCYQDGRAAGVE